MSTTQGTFAEVEARASAPRLNPQAGEVDETSTVAEARDYVARNRAAGVECPCCGRLVKVYSRRLTASAGRLLGRLYNEYGMRECHLERLGRRVGVPTGARTALSHFGVVEPGEGRGFHKLTPLGARWVRGEVKIPDAVYVGPKGERLGTSTREIGFDEVCGRPLDLKQDMSTAPV